MKKKKMKKPLSKFRASSLHQHLPNLSPTLETEQTANQKVFYYVYLKTLVYINKKPCASPRMLIGEYGNDMHISKSIHPQSLFQRCSKLLANHRLSS